MHVNSKFKIFHAGLSSYFEIHNLQVSDVRSDCAIVLLIDKRYRIFCRPASHGDLVLESHLVNLPDDVYAADELISHALMGSWVRMRDHADIPVLSEDENEITLQQRVSIDATADEFEKALEEFTNSLVQWRRIFRIL
jgi:hypothetical protein